MNKKYLYHLTTKNAVKDILKNGLEPRIGERSTMIGETEPAIYICDKYDIPYWQAILGLDSIIKIDASDITLSSDDAYTSMSCTEYLWKKPIPPEKLTTIKTKPVSSEIVHELCLDYMYNISSLCRQVAQYYTYKENKGIEDKERLRNSLTTTLQILNRLDYSLCTTKEMRSELREIGDGGFSFVDHYDVNWDMCTKIRPRLYTMLIRFEKDDLYPIRHELYKFITKNFKSCLDVETGGWTG